jgi:hypothetical protein
MQIEYRDSKSLVFSGKVIGTVEILKGISDVDVEIVKYLITNDYFKSLVDSETVILREDLPIESEDLPIESEVVEKPETVLTAKKRKPTIEFNGEPE